MEIKPCAHCGGEARIFIADNNGYQFSIFCSTCQVSTAFSTETNEVTDIWNSRVEQPSEADRWLKEATEQRARADLAEAQRDELAEYLEAIKRGMAYGGVIQ